MNLNPQQLIYIRMGKSRVVARVIRNVQHPRFGEMIEVEKKKPGGLWSQPKCIMPSEIMGTEVKLRNLKERW